MAKFEVFAQISPHCVVNQFSTAVGAVRLEEITAMVETHDHFEQRLAALGRKHEKMTHGYTTKITRDGLIVVQPKRSRVLRGSAVLQVLVLACLGFFAFKVFALAAVGPATYEDRLAALSEGTVLEQAGATALAVDPITAVLADQVRPFLR